MQIYRDSSYKKKSNNISKIPEMMRHCSSMEQAMTIIHHTKADRLVGEEDTSYLEGDQLA
jgi:hypothetical protein